MEVPGTVVSEDPRLPGFFRVQEEGKRPYFRTPFPRKALWSGRQVTNYLEQQHNLGKLLEVDASMFDFKRKIESVVEAKDDEVEVDEQEGTISKKSCDTPVDKLKFMVQQMMINPEAKLDHQAELSKTASLLDKELRMESTESAESTEEKLGMFCLLQEKLAESRSVEEMMGVLFNDIELNQLMCRLSQNICFEELVKIDTKSGPLVSFPPSVNANMFCDLVRFGLEDAPKTIEFLFGFVVKRGQSVRPSHVIKLASLFANLCFTTNHDLDALIKLRSLTLQMDSLTDQGLSALALQELTATARSLDNLRDTFSAVGPMMAKALSATMSTQSAVDNCDIDSEHLTVEYVMYEARSASHLDTKPMEKEETKKLFCLDTVLLSHAVNQEEKHHLTHQVLAVGVGHILAKERPEKAKVLAKHLPNRHRHINSDKKLTPAQVVVNKPYPYMETKNSDTVLLCLQRQKLYLQRVASWMQQDQGFLKDLALLQDCEVEETMRVAAESRVKAVCLVYGENISHGDLLTVAMLDSARLIMSGSTTALGRLEYLGNMRLGLMHLKMKKVCVDYAAMMPSVVNFDDVGCLAWMSSICQKTRISNNPKEIKKNDDSFEYHDQWWAEISAKALANMFDNYLLLHPDSLTFVVDEASSTAFVVALLNFYGVLEGMVFNPDQEVVAKKPGEDDLFSTYQGIVTRFLPSLALDLCEQEGDGEGLLAVERLMVSYFLASNLRSQNSKYADFTLFDLVLLLSSSERTRQRYMDNATINPSGTRGGGMFWDKYCEVGFLDNSLIPTSSVQIVVRSIKECLRRQHGGLDDILIEKDIGGLSVLSSLNQHQRMSLLIGKIGKERSQDLVKEPARSILKEQITKLDPFCRSRIEEPVVFVQQVRCNPYQDFKVEMLERHLARKSGEWDMKH